MSQAGLVDIESSHPQIPTSFDTDSGTAVPLANVLEILGSTVANATNAQPLFTKGSGNTVTAEIQVGAAITGAPGDTNDAGLVSFDDSSFSVDANGYVTLIGGSLAIDTLTGDDAVAVGPDGVGNLNFTGETVANATNAKPLYFDGNAVTFTQNLEIQVAAAITGAPGDKNDAGLASFDDAAFSVDSDGYVTLLGGGEAIDSNTGDDSVEVSPDLAGNFNWLGQTVANATHAKPVYFKDSATANALDLDVQVATERTGAPGDKNDAGLSSYDDTQFVVDADGYVTLVGGSGLAAVQTLTSDDPTIVGPDASGNIDLTGEAVANATNAKPVFVDAGANALNVEVQVAAAVTGAPGDKLDAGLSSYDDVFHAVDADGYVDLTSNWEATSMHGWNGSIIETVDVNVTSDGATITLDVAQEGGGDLTVVFSDPDLYYDWDTTPADTVTLNAGTDTVPVLNYVYFLNSTKTLTASTVGWPATEHAPIASVLCQSAASLQTEGAYKVHVWTDHVVASDSQGHIGDINFWIRQQPATWVSGVTQTYTITTNGGSADNVVLTTTAGVVLQLHEHVFPAFAGTPDYYVVNDNATPYTKVTDLNALLTDANGVSMSGKYFSLVIWGCVSEDTGDCKLFVNLPEGSYNSQNGVLDDVDAFSVYTIPSVFRGTGFLISEWKLRHQAASSGTWTSIDEINLLGLFPSLAAGGSPGAVTFTTDSGVATPASNNINVVGSTVANATNAQPLFTTGATDVVTAEIQVAAAVTGAPGDKNDAGLSSYDDTVFAVDADGYVEIIGGTFVTSITGGPGITVTGTAAVPIINSVVYTDQTATTLAVDSGTFATAAGAYVLPAAPTIGELVEIVCTTTGIIVTANTGQAIQIGADVTSTAGTATNSSKGDSLWLRYRDTDSIWYSLSTSGVWVLA